MSWNPNQPPEQPGEPYQTESPQQPYEQQQQPGGPYGYYPPQRPRSLADAIHELPSQYVKILSRPGAASFSEEQGKAEWNIIWAQLLFLGLLGSIIGLLSQAASPTDTVGATLNYFARFSIISVPISFFITAGIQYLLARALRGTGTFKTQAYNQLLYMVPLTVLAYILQLIPLVGTLLGAIVGIYELVLNVFAIMAAHRLTSGRATLVVLLPVIVLSALAIIALMILALQHVAF